MINLDLTLRTRFWSFTFTISPFYWDFKPEKYGAWSQDLNNLIDSQTCYTFLCFTLKIKKRIDIIKLLCNKATKL